MNALNKSFLPSIKNGETPNFRRVLTVFEARESGALLGQSVDVSVSQPDGYFKTVLITRPLDLVYVLGDNTTTYNATSI
jgi:hypothetical protein